QTEVPGSSLQIAVDGNAITIDQPELDDLQNRFMSQGRIIEKAEISVEKNEENKEKLYINFDLIKPVKLLWFIDTTIAETVKVDGQSLTEVSTQRPWWSIFTREKSPRDSIPYYCEENTDCNKYEDTNQCNGTLYCDIKRKACKINPSTITECPKTYSGDGCLANTCNTKNGKCEMTPVATGVACDDGNLCTANETCNEGACAGGNYTCQCQKNSDCQAFEDNTICNGTLYCNAENNKCEVNPATIINCYTNQTNGCTQNICNPQSGKCEVQAVNIGHSCQSPGACYDTKCTEDGQCLASWNYDKYLDSGNKCECANNADCSKLEDGNLCNGTLFCNQQTGTCELNPTTVVNCPSVYDTECKINLCEPKTGQCKMAPVNIGGSCTGGHSCDDATCSQQGECVQTWNYEKVINNTVKCECAENSDCDKLEDGNLCNGILYCDKAMGTCKLNPSTTVYCQTVNNTDFQENICQPTTGKCVMTKIQ
ncbi:MAG: hypothetical protein ACD_22C00253G0013, partial [uncultured bacterium]